MRTRAAADSNMTDAVSRKQIQYSLPGISGIEDAIDQLADAGIEERGAIFTKREVVDFILDLVGYTVDKPLHTFTILEPSFGAGDFLFAIVERLLGSCRKRAKGKTSWLSLREAVRGVELHKKSFLSGKARVESLLRDHGCTPKEAQQLSASWLSQ
jgi:hypothetical protein